MDAFVGTSGFSYKPWKGGFYPQKFPDKDMLAFYAERLSSVEINNTFYRMPKREVLEKWCTQVPESFRFTIKASRRITHHGRLKEESFDSVDYLYRQLEALGERRGPVLFQTPPYVRLDLERLTAFVEHLPEGARAAFDFRHRSFFCDSVYELFKKHDVAMAIVDRESDEDTHETPFEATASWGFLRLRREDYDGKALGEWAEKIRGAGWTAAYVYFMHEDEGEAPHLALRMSELLGGASPAVQETTAAPDGGGSPE